VSSGSAGSEPARQVLVAGTAGGVGTTTITALLFSDWGGRSGAPRLADHTAGDLGRRLSDGDQVGRLDESAVLVDVGPTAWSVVDELADRRRRLVIVTAASPLGCDLAAECLERVETTSGADGLARTALAVVGAGGRHRVAGRVRALGASRPELLGLVVVGPDPALAAGGRIPWSRLGRRTREASAQLAGMIAEGRTAAGVRVSP
jgi:hypothetical protein